MPHVDPFKSGVLDKERHSQLIADVDNYARDAGIQSQWVWTPLATACGPDEIEYARRFKRYVGDTTVAGLCLTGKASEGVEMKMAALAGCFVRNFIRANFFRRRGGRIGRAVAGTASPPDRSSQWIAER